MMRRIAIVAALLAGAPLLSGCVAAVAAIPLAAGGTMARQQLRGSEERAAERAARNSPTVAPAPATDHAAGAGPPAPPPIAVAPAVPTTPAGMQYLYGSGEAAALSVQAYQALWRYLSERSLDRRSGREIASVVLSPGATLVAPRFESCGDKQLAVVFDIDETVLLNLGYEHDEAARALSYDDARWRRWEATGADKVAAVPGAVEAVEAARRANIAVVFNSNRSLANASHTAAALARAGLGSAQLGTTLWLRGDGPGMGGKDARRWEIAKQYCVVALVGDQLGDFSDLFNAADTGVTVRRNLASETMVAPLWGAGWFLLPNPVYGSALRGELNEIFPEDKRWIDPAEEAK